MIRITPEQYREMAGDVSNYAADMNVVAEYLRTAADQLEAVPSGERWFHKAMKARGERERLSGIIHAAPHSATCYYEQTAHWDEPKPCDCWKADAILTADIAPPA